MLKPRLIYEVADEFTGEEGFEEDAVEGSEYDESVEEGEYTDSDVIDDGYTDQGFIDEGYIEPGFIDDGYIDPGFFEEGYMDPAWRWGWRGEGTSAFLLAVCNWNLSYMLLSV